MTGYGKAETAVGAGKLTVEIRSLNAKSAEINIKSQILPKEQEIELRKLLSDSLVRGTIDVYLTLESGEAAGAKTINSSLAKAYMDQAAEILPEIAEDANAKSGILSAILRFPDVVDAKRADVLTDADRPAIRRAFEQAIAALEEYRTTEGAVLYRDITSRIKEIQKLYDGVEALEPERTAAVKDRLVKNLAELQVKVAPERFEQEMIFYLEKFDINEEKVRLRQHCRYFMETIDSEPYPGKKLGFIIQEMGREINTTGSKANHAGIQKLVVQMKDELEKIREQSMNVL